MAKRLVRDGFASIVNYGGSFAKAEEVVAELKARGAHAMAVQADVANAADVERLFTQALEVFGRFEVVVHCAGTVPLFPTVHAPHSARSHPSLVPVSPSL